MKSIKVLIALLMLAFVSSAQVQNGNFSRVTVKDSIWVNGSWIKSITNDSTSLVGASNVLPSQHSVIGTIKAAAEAVNILWYGAKPNDGIDDAISIQAAINSGRPVFIPKGDFHVATSIQLGDKKVIYGLGEGSQLITIGNIPLFTIQGNNTQISNLSLSGSGRGTATPYATTRPLNHGVKVDGTSISPQKYSNVLITSCSFRGFGGAALYCKNNSSYQFTPGLVVSQCYLGSSLVGAWCDTAGEYNSFTGCVANGNEYGYRIAGGNNNVTGGQITSNKTGVFLDGGTGNDGHSVASGVAINHNVDYAIYAEDITEGYTFNACMIYYGGIWLKNSQLLTFDNCDINTTGNGLKEEGAKDCYFRNCKFRQFPGHQPNYNGIPSRVFFSGNTFDDLDLGIKPYRGYFGYNIVGGFWRGGIKADVSIPTGSTYFMDYDSTLFNGVSGNFQNYTLDTFFNRPQRKFISKGYGAGMATLNGQILVEIPIAGSAQNIFCIVNTINRVTPSTQRYVRRPCHVYNGGSSWQLAFDLNFSIEIEPTDDIEIYFINQSGQTATIDSAGDVTFLSIMGL